MASSEQNEMSDQKWITGKRERNEKASTESVSEVYMNHSHNVRSFVPPRKHRTVHRSRSPFL